MCEAGASGLKSYVLVGLKGAFWGFANLSLLVARGLWWDRTRLE